ncbi:RNA-binding protein [Candidatus Woesearchaeota archaeon CG10_big_fil_rev_8_21_14_0_10_36_11]|nr:MAG: RNA-binding protein [Candidatus Woesearchaeota archaeon CG10_big_fil_rev_8_21_14_0_10_36_11]
MEGKICSSCKKRIVNDKGSVIFMCPKCSQQEIVRCATCRSIATKYTCHQCGFVGPN